MSATLADLDEINRSLDHNLDVFKDRALIALGLAVVTGLLFLYWRSRWWESDISRYGVLGVLIALGLTTVIVFLSGFGALFAGVGGTFILVMTVITFAWYNTDR